MARSCVDYASIVLSIFKKTQSDDRGIDSTTKDPRSRLDRAAIAVRSDRDRGVLPLVFYTVRLNLQVSGRSDRDREAQLIAAV